jgi:hypothetical protein
MMLMRLNDWGGSLRKRALSSFSHRSYSLM